MKPRKKPTKKVAKASAAAKQLNVNLDYVQEITDESIAASMAKNGLIRMLVAENDSLRNEIAVLRAQLEELK